VRDRIEPKPPPFLVRLEEYGCSSANWIPKLGRAMAVGEIPAAVFVIEAESRRIVYANAGASEMTERLGRVIPDELSDDWEIYRPDGPAVPDEGMAARALDHLR
jgi:hypothetical protein